MKAVVKQIQVGGIGIYHSLEAACSGFQRMINGTECYRTKMIFVIKLPDGSIRLITIRDDDNETVAYGDFEGLPSFLDYAKELFDESVARP